MQVSAIYIYPIKSLGGIALPSAKAEIKGFQHDRRWMLVDESGTFLTQRKYPQMALLQVTLENDGLRISHKKNEEKSLFVAFEPQKGNVVQVIIWDDVVGAIEVSNVANDWFTEQLGMTCKLVYMPDVTERKIKAKYAVNEESVSFADGMPYLLIGQSSLDDLNGKLDNPVPMNRFRPNLVFTGAEAFEEDQWNYLQIGAISFKVTKPCARCVLTTVDQATGKKGNEPLKTLASYRLMDKKIMFGQNMICLEEGVVSVGDEIRLSH
ncbi:MOSC domain-containing protein [Pararhodonellum marinum]|uniref:MOSC domain-containing protein n=1 Tax=Pararhodonellum marinum TaxID=2755358 RepID=UPI001890AF12|nr:MOSC domain-containing protein [Pararhodonellum marinum]